MDDDDSDFLDVKRSIKKFYVECLNKLQEAPCWIFLQRNIAYARLWQALRVQNIQQIYVACFKADVAGVDPVFVAKARSQGDKLKAISNLKQVVRTEFDNIERVIQACQAAEDAGVSAHAISDLSQAVERKSASASRKAENAKEVLTIIQTYCSAEDQMGQQSISYSQYVAQAPLQSKAVGALKAAVNGDDVRNFLEAYRVAKAVGVKPAAMSEVLRIAEQKAMIASREASNAQNVAWLLNESVGVVRHDDPNSESGIANEQLREAASLPAICDERPAQPITHNVTVTKDVARILRACSEAEHAGVDQVAISHMRQVAEQKLSADVEKAMASKDVERIVSAYTTAEETGLDPALISYWGKCITKLNAATDLAQAINTDDVGRIIESCHAAEAAGVDFDLVSKARYVIEKFQVASALRDAMQVEISLLDPKLPLGWESAKDPVSKRMYYFNRENQESTWEHPGKVLRDEQISRVLDLCSDAVALGVDRELISEARAVANRWRATIALRESTNSKNAWHLMMACREAEAVGVDKSLIFEARLDARRRTAAAQLQDAVSTENVAGILSSCLENETVGADPAIISKARKLAERIQAENALEDAMRTDEVPKIIEACENAARTGVNPLFVSEATQKAERKACENLNEAVAAEHVGRIVEACQDATLAKVTPALIAEAHKVARRLKASAELRSIINKCLGPRIDTLRDELPPNWSTARDPATDQLYYYNRDTGETSWDNPVRIEDAKLLEAVVRACHDAEAVGIEPELMSTGRRVVEGLKAELSLKDAIKEKSLEMVVQRCLEAEATECDRTVIAKGWQAVDQLKSRLAIKDAVDAQDMEQIMSACREGEVACVDPSEISEARRVAKRLKADAGTDPASLFDSHRIAGIPAQVKAGAALMKAVATDDIDIIEQACCEAEAGGVDPKLISLACHAVTRIKAAAALQAAVSKVGSAEDLPKGWESTNDPSTGRLYYFNRVAGESRWEYPFQAVSAENAGEIMDACHDAELAGVDAAITSKALLIAGRLMSAAKLKEAIITENTARIMDACVEAESADVHEAMIFDARKMARRLNAAAALKDAMSSNNVSKIRLACQEAATAEVDPGLVQGARNLVRRLKASAAIKDAIKNQDFGRLLSACYEAEEAGVDPSVIQAAQRTGKQLKAAAVLREAVQKQEVWRIVSACNEAEKAGVDRVMVSEGRRIADRLKAGAALHEAVRMENVERIVEACNAAEVAGVKQSLIKDARRVALRCKATAALKNAMRSDDAGFIELACREAEAAGVEASMVSKARRIADHKAEAAVLKEAIIDKRALRRVLPAGGQSNPNEVTLRPLRNAR